MILTSAALIVTDCIEEDESVMHCSLYMQPNVLYLYLFLFPLRRIEELHVVGVSSAFPSCTWTIFLMWMAPQKENAACQTEVIISVWPRGPWGLWGGKKNHLKVHCKESFLFVQSIENVKCSSNINFSFHMSTANSSTSPTAKLDVMQSCALHACLTSPSH